jgi:hypothetical protein
MKIGLGWKRISLWGSACRFSRAANQQAELLLPSGLVQAGTGKRQMNFGQDTPFGEATYPARTKHRLHKEHRKLCGLGGHRKTGHTWSLQNRP